MNHERLRSHHSAFLLMACFCGQFALGQQNQITTTWANTADCPVKILAVGPVIEGTTIDLFGRIFVGNSSAKGVTAVQFAWSIEDPSSGRQPYITLGSENSTKLNAGDVTEVGRQNADGALVLKYLSAIDKPSFALAVILVRFEDGSVWRRTLDSKTRFRETQPAGESFSPFKEKLEQFKMKSSPLAAARSALPETVAE